MLFRKSVAASLVRVGPHGDPTVFASKLVFQILPFLTVDAGPTTSVAIFANKFEFVKLARTTASGGRHFPVLSGPDYFVRVYGQTVRPTAHHGILV